MIIRCPECGVQYRIDGGRLSDQTRIFRCNQCGEILRQAPSSENAPTPPATKIRYLLISCPDCGTKYRLSAQRLTEGKSGLRCRHCDRIIPLRRQQLPRSLKVQVIRTDQPQSKLSQAQQPVFQTYPGKPKFTNTKIVLLASAAAGLLALIITGIFFGYPLLHPKGSQERILREAQIRSEAAPADAEGHPFVLLEADLPALQRELAKRLPFISDDPRWQLASAVLKIAELRRAKLFLFPDAESQMLPVLVLQGNKAAELTKTLLRSYPLKRILLPAEGAAYRFSPKALETVAGSGFPAESYRIWFHTDWLVCAPQNQTRLWADGKARWDSFSVTRFPETFGGPIQLAGLAVRIPEDLPAGWTDSLIPDSAQDSDPESMQTIDAAADFLALLDSSIQQIDSMAGVFRFDGEKGRLLHYAQQFRQGIDGNRVFNRLQSAKNPHDRTSMGAILSKLLHHDRLDTSVELHESRLTVRLEWQADADRALLKAVIEAVLGPNRSDIPGQSENISAAVDQKP